MFVHVWAQDGQERYRPEYLASEKGRKRYHHGTYMGTHGEGRGNTGAHARVQRHDIYIVISMHMGPRICNVDMAEV